MASNRGPWLVSGDRSQRNNPVVLDCNQQFVCEVLRPCDAALIVLAPALRDALRAVLDSECRNDCSAYPCGCWEDDARALLARLPPGDDSKEKTRG